MTRSHQRVARFGATTLISLSILAACGGEPDEGRPTASGDIPTAAHSAGDAAIDADADLIANAFSITQGDKFSGYQVEGSTVRFQVADGASLSGSECLIITAAANGIDATFIMVEPDGAEVQC